jgi:hypothetical protein
VPSYEVHWARRCHCLLWRVELRLRDKVESEYRLVTCVSVHLLGEQQAHAAPSIFATRKPVFGTRVHKIVVTGRSGARCDHFFQGCAAIKTHACGGSSCRVRDNSCGNLSHFHTFKLLNLGDM